MEVRSAAEGSSPSAAGSVSKVTGGAGEAAGSGWDLPKYGEILIDAPPGGWEGVVSGEAI